MKKLVRIAAIEDDGTATAASWVSRDKLADEIRTHEARWFPRRVVVLDEAAPVFRWSSGEWDESKREMAIRALMDERDELRLKVAALEKQLEGL